MEHKIMVIATMLLSTVSIFSQTITYETNSPRSGDIVYKEVVDYFDPGNSGNHALWDFRDIIRNNASESVEYFIGPDSMLWEANPSSICRFYQTSDSLLLLSSETPYLDITYTVPVTFQVYPYAYGYVMNNNYEGIGTYCQKQAVKDKGTMIVEIDGAGSLITSDGDTLSHVVRLHSVLTSSLHMYGQMDTLCVDSSNIKQKICETYQWYVKGYRYPLYETSSTCYYEQLNLLSCIQKAYMYSAEKTVLAEDGENKKILEDIQNENSSANDIIHYTVSNTGTTLQMNYSLDENANINSMICNNTGIVYGRKVAHLQAGTDYQMTFDISFLPRGEYVLYINVNGKVYNEKFEKKHE